MANKLCAKCREFDRIMNGGPLSFDVWVVCNHDRLEHSIRKDSMDKIHDEGIDRGAIQSAPV